MDTLHIFLVVCATLNVLSLAVIAWAVGHIADVCGTINRTSERNEKLTLAVLTEIGKESTLH